MTNQPTEDFRGYGPGPELGPELGPESGPVAAVEAEVPQRWWHRMPWLLGLIALIIGLATVVVDVIAIVQASALHWESGTTLAWVAIGLSAAAFLVGLAAVILNRGRRWGVAAMVLGVLANPVVLVQLFRLVG